MTGSRGAAARGAIIAEPAVIGRAVGVGEANVLAAVAALRRLLRGACEPGAGHQGMAQPDQAGEEE